MTYERFPLAQLPTPLDFADRLTEAWGGPQIWIKRDDLTGFGLSGNKVRKLEYHVAAAKAAGATTLVTCGAVQSNHCRATAIAAAKTGMKCVLLLRSRDGGPPERVEGNHLLQRLAGAEVRFITPRQWHDREALMVEVAAELAAVGEQAWTMPAGASDRLGVAAFDNALVELSEQIDGPVTIWHASSSAGTTAGLALGVARNGFDMTVVGASVGESEAELGDHVSALLAEAGGADAPFEVIDDYVGLGYGKTTDEELHVQMEATRLTGLIWDPTYTGKALYALKREIDRGRFAATDKVVFWHTGGGFAAFAHTFPLEA
jgi:D-cysteine desulfhydrase